MSTKGFTLFEAMIAMALLAVGLAAPIGHQAVAVQMSHSGTISGRRICWLRVAFGPRAHACVRKYGRVG